MGGGGSATQPASSHFHLPRCYRGSSPHPAATGRISLLSEILFSSHLGADGCPGRSPGLFWLRHALFLKHRPPTHFLGALSHAFAEHLLYARINRGGCDVTKLTFRLGLASVGAPQCVPGVVQVCSWCASGASQLYHRCTPVILQVSPECVLGIPQVCFRCAPGVSQASSSPFHSHMGLQH